MMMHSPTQPQIIKKAFSLRLGFGATLTSRTEAGYRAVRFTESQLQDLAGFQTLLCVLEGAFVIDHDVLR